MCVCPRRELRVGVFEKKQREQRIESEKSINGKYMHRGKIYLLPGTYEYASCKHNSDTDAAVGKKKDSPNNPTAYADRSGKRSIG